MPADVIDDLIAMTPEQRRREIGEFPQDRQTRIMDAIEQRVIQTRTAAPSGGPPSYASPEFKAAAERGRANAAMVPLGPPKPPPASAGPQRGGAPTQRPVPVGRGGIGVQQAQRVPVAPERIQDNRTAGQVATEQAVSAGIGFGAPFSARDTEGWKIPDILRPVVDAVVLPWKIPGMAARAATGQEQRPEDVERLKSVGMLAASPVVAPVQMGVELSNTLGTLASPSTATPEDWQKSAETGGMALNQAILAKAAAEPWKFQGQAAKAVSPILEKAGSALEYPANVLRPNPVDELARIYPAAKKVRAIGAEPVVERPYTGPLRTEPTPVRNPGTGGTLMQPTPAAAKLQSGNVAPAIHETLRPIIEQAIDESGGLTRADFITKGAGIEGGASNAIRQRLAERYGIPSAESVPVEVARRTADIAGRPIAEAVRQLRNMPIEDTIASVKADINAAAKAAEGLPDLQRSLTSLAGEVSGKTVSELHDLVAQWNKRSKYADTTGGQIAADAQASGAFREAQNIARRHLYDKMEQLLPDVDRGWFREAGRIQKDAIDFANINEDWYNTLNVQNKPFLGKTGQAIQLATNAVARSPIRAAGGLARMLAEAPGGPSTMGAFNDIWGRMVGGARGTSTLGPRYAPGGGFSPDPMLPPLAGPTGDPLGIGGGTRTFSNPSGGPLAGEPQPPSAWRQDNPQRNAVWGQIQTPQVPMSGQALLPEGRPMGESWRFADQGRAVENAPIIPRGETTIIPTRPGVTPRMRVTEPLRPGLPALQQGTVGEGWQFADMSSEGSIPSFPQATITPSWPKTGLIHLAQDPAIVLEATRRLRSSGRIFEMQPIWEEPTALLPERASGPSIGSMEQSRMLPSQEQMAQKFTPYNESMRERLKREAVTARMPLSESAAKFNAMVAESVKSMKKPTKGKK